MENTDSTIIDIIREYIIKHGDKPKEIIVSNEVYANTMLDDYCLETASRLNVIGCYNCIIFMDVEVHTETTMQYKIAAVDANNKELDRLVAEQRELSKSITYMHNLEPKDYTVLAFLKRMFTFE